jgi:hypothetical protein
MALWVQGGGNGCILSMYTIFLLLFFQHPLPSPRPGGKVHYIRSPFYLERVTFAANLGANLSIKLLALSCGGNFWRKLVLLTSDPKSA